MLEKVLLVLTLAVYPLTEQATLQGVTVSGDANGLVIFEGGVCNACVASLNISYANVNPANLLITTSNGSRTLLNTNLETGMMVVLLRDLDFPGYGMHDMVISVTEGADSYTGNYVAIVDEPIEGLEVTAARIVYLHVEEVIEFNVTMTNGTNVFVGVDFGDFVEVTRDCDGQSVVGITFNFTHNYTSLGVFTVEVVASNYVNKMSYIFQVVVVDNLVVAAAESKSLIETLEPVVFQITTTHSTPSNMGNVTIALDCGGSVTELNTTLITGSGRSLSCSFVTQGNYTASVTVSNGRDTYVYSPTINVFDKLNVSLEVPSSVAAGIPVTVTVVNPPKVGFLYKVEYGQGDVDEVSDRAIFLTNYSDLALRNPVFPDPECYNVTFVAYNDYYVAVQYLCVCAFYPIPNSTLEVAPEGIHLLPDDTSVFSIKTTTGTTAPNPNNVTCDIDYGDGTVITNQTTDMDFSLGSLGLQWEYNYTATVLASFTMVCRNAISNHSYQATIDARKFDATTFNVTYDKFYIMNDTATAVHVVELELFGLTKLPKNVQLTWDFGDGSTLSGPMAAYNMTHIYNGRGNYPFSLVIDHQTPVPTSKTHSDPIRGGVMDLVLTSNFDVGLINDHTFTFTVHSFDTSQPVTYTLEFGDATQSATISTATATQTHVYTQAGLYYPVLTASTPRGVEITTLPVMIIIENPVRGLTMECPEFATLGQELELKITLNATFLPLTNLTCYFHALAEGLDIPANEYFLSMVPGGPALSSVLTMDQMGVVLVYGNCSNRLSRQDFALNVTVFSTCFTDAYLFDKAYRSPSTPLEAYVDKPPVLASRVEMMCANETLALRWKVFNLTSAMETPVNFDYPLSTRLITANYPVLLQAGFYRVELEMGIVAGDLLTDRMYLKLLVPPLVAVVFGGSMLTKGSNDILTLDAIKESYAPEIGWGKENGLSCTWSCYIFSTDRRELEPYLLPTSSDNNYQTRPSCGLTLPSSCVIQVPLSSLTPDVWVLFEVNVTRDTRDAVALQGVIPMTIKPPSVEIICKWNCLKKLAPENLFTVQSNITCGHCQPGELDTLLAVWTVFKMDNVTKTWKNVTEWGDSFYTKRFDREFSVKGGYFKGGESYMLELTVITSIGRNGTTSYIIDVNQPPYDGSCKLVPEGPGMAAIDDFWVQCSGWRDEGYNKLRDFPNDLGRPLSIRVLMVVTNGTYLLSAGEGLSSLPRKFPLCAPDPGTGVDCQIIVRIYDTFKAYAETNLTLTLKNPLGDLPNLNVAGLGATGNGTANSTDTLVDFLARLEDRFNATQKAQDPIKSATLAATYASIISSILNEPPMADDLSAIDKAGDSSPVQDASNNLLTELRSTNEQQESLTQFQDSMVNAVSNSVAMLVNSTDPVVLETLAQAMASTVSSPAYVSEEAQLTITTDLLALSNTMVGVASNTRESSTPENMLQAIAIATNTVLNVSSPDLSFLAVDDTGANPLNNSGALTDGDPDTGFNLVESQYFKEEAKRKKELEEQKRIRNAPKVVVLLENVFNNTFAIMDRLMANGTSMSVKQPFFTLEAIKDTLKNILERQESNNGSETDYRIQGVEGMDTTSMENLKMQVKILEKNMYIEGPLAKLITNQVVITEIKDADGNVLTMVNPEVTYADPNPVPRVTIHPILRPEDASQMFYQKFLYRDLSETACIRIMPQNHHVAYEVFWRSTIAPMDYAPMYDLRSLPEYITQADRADFTVCAPTGSLKRRGVCWVGIKPYVMDLILTFETSRKKRAAGNETAVATTPPASSSNGELNSPFELELLTVSCLSLDGSTHKWNPNDCKLIRDSPNSKTRCVCTSRTKMVSTSSFSLAPNHIDFSSVFSKFDIQSQGAILGTLALILVIYGLAVVWASWKDRQDVFQWGVTLLSDNFQDDNYFYLITVYTGMVANGGTKSNISFTLYGDFDETGIRNLTDGVRKEFRSGSVMHFLMAVPQHLGQLHYMRIWHDNSGKGNNASWFLNRIEIHDIQTGDRSDFLCGQWLSVEEACLEKTLAVGTKDNLRNFKTLFYEHARQHVTDDHLWMSVFLRPVKSHFSRVQRVSCCLAFLFLAMIANAMFYYQKPRKDRVQPYDFEIGPIKFSWSQLYYSFVSAILTAIPLFIIITMFRKSKLKHREKRSDDWQLRCMPPYFRKLYMESVELEKVLVVKDIVDDEEGVLPFWCVYIGWTLLVLSVLVPGFFVVLYSMQWGKTVTEEWLMSFFLSFAESVFMVDPFKIIFLAVIFAALLKSMKNTRPTEFDLKKISSISFARGLPTGVRRQITVRSFITDEDLLRAKAKRERDLTLKAALKDLVYNLLFLWALVSICYSNRDPRGYAMITNIRNQLVSPPPPPVETATIKARPDFEKVSDAVKFFEWFNETMLPFMFPENDYRGEPLGQLDRLHLTDLVNYRVGPPRLRQLRMPKDSCLFPYVGKVKCYKQYSIIDEEDGTFCKSWKSPPCSEKDELIQTFDAWRFHGSAEIFGVPLSGLMALYGGGGYIADIDINRPIALEALKELHDFMWIDRHTRAVFVEFTLYCTNVNIFAYVSLMAEFPETGGIMPKTSVYPFRVMQHVGPLGYYILFCEVCFIIFLVAWVIAILPSLVKERLNYLKNFWNVVGLVVIAFSIAGVALYFVRENYTADALRRFRENNRLFVNFSHIAIWDEIFIYVLGFLVCIASLRVLKVMAYTTKTEAVYTVLRESSKTLPGFSFYIFNVLFCFALMGYVAFGRLDDKYRDPAVTLETLFSGVLGDGKFKPERGFLSPGDDWLQRTYYICFVIMVVIALSNLFLAILLDTMSMLGDPSEKTMDLELTSYIWQNFLGVVNRKGKSNEQEADEGAANMEANETTEIPGSTKDPIFTLKGKFK